MYKRGSRMSFVAGFIAGAVICGVALVYSGAYTPGEGDWITTFQGQTDPDGNDLRIRVLADIAPGAGTVMQAIGLRLNTLNRAGKKKNWGLAGHELHEMEEDFERLAVTRPSLEGAIDNFLQTSFKAVEDAVNAKSKGQFKKALKSMIAGCTSCHADSGKSFIVVKPGKSAMPIK